MFTLKLTYPANVEEFFAMIFPIVALDVLPLEKITDSILEFEESASPVSYQLESLGYESINLIPNLGNIFYDL